MPVVEVNDTILASLEDVYGLICNADKYAQLFPTVAHVEVLERYPLGATTSWVMDVDGLKFRWDQRDEYRPEEKTLYFKQIEGDMLKFEGVWSFSEIPEGTKAALYLDFDPGIPMLTGIFHYILIKKVRETLQDLLKGLKDNAEKTQLGLELFQINPVYNQDNLGQRQL